MIASSIVALSLAIWIYLAVGRGGFWRGLENDDAMHANLALRRARTPAWPRVTAVIPARNEADLVGLTVASLLEQRYDGALSIVVVDDHSDDGTADVARRAACAAGYPERVVVVAAPPLPADWTGKLWAVATGVAHVEQGARPPELLLLTDADIRYRPDAVAALVSSAVEQRLVMTSLMVRLRCRSLAERMLIPAFVFFFQMLYPFAWVNRPDRRTAAAAGGCMLIDREALRAAGGIAAIRGALIDDCALGLRMKAQGPIRLELGDRVESLRPYPSFGEIRRMVVRSAYAQLRFSPGRLLFAMVAMLVVFVAPVVAVIATRGVSQGIGLAAWALMGGLFVPTLRRYRVSAWWSGGLPLIASAYLGFMIESAIRHAIGQGGVWKGRVNGERVVSPP